MCCEILYFRNTFQYTLNPASQNIETVGVSAIVMLYSAVHLSTATFVQPPIWPQFSLNYNPNPSLRLPLLEQGLLDCKGNLTDLRRELHLSLAKGNPK
jgi:hypothetical protein